MRVVPIKIFLIFFIFILLVDGLLFLINRANKSSKHKLVSIFLITTFLLGVAIMLFVMFTYSTIRNIEGYQRIFLFTGYFMSVYVPKVIFLLHYPIIFLFRMFVFGRVIKKILFRFALIVSGFIFLGFVHGVIWGKYKLSVNKVVITDSNLPDDLSGLRIAHISDIHLGSLVKNRDYVREIVNMINNENPDFIFFTGDLINNYAEELEGWDKLLMHLKAKYGKYAILGNHDYGDYSFWKDKKAKEENFNQLIEFYKTINFKVLMDTSYSIPLGNSILGIIGVENCGKPPFPCYTDLEKAMANTKHFDYKILLTHDPSHWHNEIKGNTDINITLSGHIHGMQSGIKIGNWKWSPAKFIYDYWSGLYYEKGQYLHITDGLGYVGFPGRVGMFPEVSLLIFGEK